MTTQVSSTALHTNPADASFGKELGATLHLAAPLALAQLAQIGMGVTDTVILGTIGHDAIAAGGLGAGTFFTLGAVLQGLVMGVGVLVAHARGAETLERIAPILRAGLLLALAAAVPLMLIMLDLEDVLLLFGEPVALAHDVAQYNHILLLAAPASLILALQRSYLAAMGRARPVMVISICALISNGCLNYGLIHGSVGLPEMGYLGSATATVITLWIAMLATAAVVHRVKIPGRLNGPIDWAVVRELASLGWPIAVTIGVEIILFMVAALMMGLMGNTVLAAHQVTINVASLTFMVPLATAQAANVRIGFHMGAKNPRSAKRAAKASFLLGVGFMAIAAAVMFIAPRQIAYLFNLDPNVPGDADVISLVVRLLWICAIFQVFDGAQTIAVGALRGLKDTRVPMVLAGFCYWVVGFPVAWVLGFHFGLGAEGIWWGLAFGLMAAALVLNVRFWRLMDRHISASNQGALSHAISGA